MRATYQDVLDAPAHLIAEIIGGELRLSPRPSGWTVSVASSLGMELGQKIRRSWLRIDKPELHLGEEILVPDLGGWRRERMASVSNDAYFTIPPDWVCEVLSPSTEKTDRAEKLAIYAVHAVAHAWLVHPKNRTLEVMRLHEGKWLTLAVHHDDQRVRAEPFDAIELDLAILWADLSG